jgi:hypothetical protein
LDPLPSSEEPFPSLLVKLVISGPCSALSI